MEALLQSFDATEWRPTLWAIPTEAEVLAWKPLFDSLPTTGPTIKRVKHYYSATTAAIMFLQAMGKDVRAQFHSITINEDHQSICLPYCHAQGLFPFCQENPKLRIVQHVDIWNALLANR